MQTNIAFVYSESIEKLRGVLSAMQNMSQKRERLENSIRSQLEREIRRLNREEGKGEENDEESLVQLKLQNTALRSDVVKVIFSDATHNAYPPLHVTSTCTNYIVPPQTSKHYS